MKVRIGIKLGVVFAIAWLLAACSNDTADVLPVPTPVVPGLDEPEEQYPDAPVWMAGVRRAPMSTDNQGNIRVFLTHGTTVSQGLFKYDDDTDTWTTELKLKSGARTYRLYGYMPDDAAFTGSVTGWSDDGAVLHIQGLSPIATKDYCVVTGVRQAADDADMIAAERGNFAFDYDSQRDNYISLFFDHLLSRVTFSMNIGEDYNKVRAIKIKSMRLVTDDISEMRADVTLARGTGISSVAFATTGTADGTLDLNIKVPEYPLTLTPTVVCGAYVIPNATLLNKLSLETEYDVYDKQGNKIAERTATNKLTEPLHELQRGEERTLQVTVAPSYLYVLSDGDLSDPPLVVN